MTEIETMPDPKPTEVIPEKALYVAIYWTQQPHALNPFAAYTVAYNKQDALKWASENIYRDPNKPIKLFRLNYGEPV